jgi:hypothetical protein
VRGGLPVYLRETARRIPSPDASAVNAASKSQSFPVGATGAPPPVVGSCAGCAGLPDSPVTTETVPATGAVPPGAVPPAPVAGNMAGGFAGFRHCLALGCFVQKYDAGLADRAYAGPVAIATSTPSATMAAIVIRIIV